MLKGRLVVRAVTADWPLRHGFVVTRSPDSMEEMHVATIMHTAFLLTVQGYLGHANNVASYDQVFSFVLFADTLLFTREFLLVVDKSDIDLLIRMYDRELPRSVQLS